MGVHVDRIQSDVQLEPEPESAESTARPAAAQPLWEELARQRALAQRIRREAARTAAEGFDD